MSLPGSLPTPSSETDGPTASSPEKTADRSRRASDGSCPRAHSLLVVAPCQGGAPSEMRETSAQVQRVKTSETGEKCTNALGRGHTRSQGSSWARTPGRPQGSAASGRPAGGGEKGIAGRQAGPAGKRGAEMERSVISQSEWGCSEGLAQGVLTSSSD